MTRRWLAAAGFGLVLLGAALIAAFAVVSTATSEREERDGIAARIEAERIVATIDRSVAELEQLAASAPSPASFRQLGTESLDQTPALRAVALARIDNGRLVVRTVAPADLGKLAARRDLTADDDLATLLAPVVTEADTSVGAPYTEDGQPLLLAAAPILAEPTGDEATRRSS